MSEMMFWGSWKPWPHDIHIEPEERTVLQKGPMMRGVQQGESQLWRPAEPPMSLQHLARPCLCILETHRTYVHHAVCCSS